MYESEYLRKAGHLIFVITVCGVPVVKASKGMHRGGWLESTRKNTGNWWPEPINIET